MPTNAPTGVGRIPSAAATKVFSDRHLVLGIIQRLLGQKEPRIRIAKREWVATRYREIHLRHCPWAQTEKLWGDGKQRYHATGVLDGTTGKVVPAPHQALADSFCNHGCQDEPWEPINVPLSVLRLRLICKATDEAVRQEFWPTCWLCSPSAAYLHDILQGITADVGPNHPAFASSHGAAQIQRIFLYFTSNGPSSYEEIAKRLPNLKELHLVIDFYRIVEFEDTAQPNTPAWSLVNAKGLKAFAIALRKHCPDLHKVTLEGDDYIRVRSAHCNQNQYDGESDIMAPGAIGPILLYNLLEATGDRWMTAADIAKATKGNKKTAPTTANKKGAPPTCNKRTAATTVDSRQTSQTTKRRKPN